MTKMMTVVDMFNSLPYDEKEELFSIGLFPTLLDSANFNLYNKYQNIDIDENLLFWALNDMIKEDINDKHLLEFTVSTSDTVILNRFISKYKLLNILSDKTLYMEDAIYMIHEIIELLTCILKRHNISNNMRTLCTILMEYLGDNNC